MKFFVIMYRRVLKYSIILQLDIENPDQTVDVQANLSCNIFPKGTILHGGLIYFISVF